MSRIRFPLSVVLPVLVTLLATGGAAFGLDFPHMSVVQSDIEPAIEANDGSRSSPIMFIENAGQWKEKAKFQVWGGSGNAMWLGEDAIWITVMEPLQESEQMRREIKYDPASDLRSSTSDPRSGVNIRLSFPGANLHPTIETFDRLDTKVSYFLGKDPDQWRPEVPVWGGLRYVDLWPGVDLELSNEDGHLVQRFVAKEGVYVKAVRMQVEGATEAKIDGGRLNLATAINDLALSLPHADFVYDVQVPIKHGQVNTLEVHQIDVASKFDSLSSTTPGDNPADLLYSTFLGGSNSDYGNAVAVDGNGSAYVMGDTISSDFPATPGAFDTSRDGGHDAFVVKLNPDGSGLVYATFLGGSSHNSGEDIAVDENGNAYVVGSSDSSDFPTTPGSFDTSYNGDYEAFVVKLNPIGSELTYSTFLGGSAADYGRGISVGGNGNAYVTGYTESNNFPTTPEAYNTSFNGGDCRYDLCYDAFVTKLNSIGSGLVYSTFLGGSMQEEGVSISVNEVGSAFVAGYTQSVDFPATSGAFDTSLNGNGDVFVARLNLTGNELVYATFLGGSNHQDYGYSIAVDGNNSAYVTGVTISSDFPSTPGAFDTSRNGGYDAYVVKLDPDGSELIYATFLGGSNDEEGKGIAVDVNGNAYVTGYTWSSNFPSIPGSFDTSYSGVVDAFVVKLNPMGSGLVYATFLGGNVYDESHGITIDEANSVFVLGWTDSSDFPTTPDAFDTSFNGGYNDAYVVKLATGGTRTIMHSFRSSTVPIIDGDLSDWASVGWVQLDETTANTISKDHPSLYDLSAYARSVWTDSTLYFAISTFDNRIVNDSVSVWHDDEIELGIDGLHDGSPSGTDDHQYTINTDGRKTDRGVSTEDFQAVVRQRIDGWDAEIAIPTSHIQGGAFHAGKIMGFNWGMHDDDTGGDYDTHLLWKSDNTFGVKPGWAVLELMADLAPSVNPLTVTPTPLGDTITLQQGFLGYGGAEDTSISQWYPITNYGDSYTLTVRGDGVIGTLLQYDLSTLPDDIAIKRATLSLYPQERSNPQAIDASVYPLLRGWNETQATWERTSSGSSWQIPGAEGITDRESVAVDHKNIDWLQSWASFDITGLVQRWIDGSLENNGIVVKQIGGPAVGYDFSSRDVMHWEDTPYRPELIISYWEPTPTATPSPVPTLTPTSTPTPTTTPTPTPLCIDGYEPDDIWQQAKLILLDSEPQQHNIHAAGDVDYVKFGVTSGAQLTLYTDNLGPNVDTTLTLYNTDGVTQLAYNDIDPLNPPASRIDWTAPANGTYFLKTANFDPTAGGCSMTYELVAEYVRPTVTATSIPLYLPIVVR